MVKVRLDKLIEAAVVEDIEDVLLGTDLDRSTFIHGC